MDHRRGSSAKSQLTYNGPNGYERSRAKEVMMKLLNAVGLRPSRSAMEDTLNKLNWSSIKGKNDVLGAVFRAAFRWVNSTKPRQFRN